MRGLLILPVLAISLQSADASAQDAAAGEKVFSQCKLCHQVGDKAKNGIGPQLNGVIGRTAGTAAGYNYSAAIKNAGVAWDEARLREFISDPKAMYPETKMPFEGLKDDQQISDLIAFLRKYDAAGAREKAAP